MKFRRDQHMYCAMLLLAIICTTAVVGGSVAVAFYDTNLVLFIFVPFSVGATVSWLSLLSYREYMVIDEAGIKCEGKCGLLWEYRWDEILKLRRVVLYRSRAIQIIPKDGCVKLKDQFNPVDSYFQLSSAAKKSLQIYCVVPIEK